MASEETGRVVLISVRPRFAALIMGGVKRVEFRKARFPTAAKDFLMYVTAPLGAVTAYFTVNRIEIGDPEAIWDRFREVAGMNHDSFREYYRGHSLAVALVIGKVMPLPQPVDLDALGHNLAPPQSFRYVPEQVLENALRRTAPHGSAGSP